MMRAFISLLSRALLGASLLLIVSCATKDTHHHVVISVPEQRMAVLEDGKLIASYAVSTSKYGLGDAPGSRRTPLGNLEIAEKIGGSAPSGAVFKDRRRTGEIVPPDSPGRDPIVSRILWLRGREPQNARAFCPHHLHSWNSGGAEHRFAGELRLRAHALARRHSTLRCRGRRSASDDR